MSGTDMDGASGPIGWLASQVRRAARNSLIWHGVILTAIGLIAWLSSTYYYNFFFGPFPYDDAKLLAAAENPGRGNLLAYIELQDHPLLPTGWEEISTTGEAIYSVVPYDMVAVGDKRMLVLAKKAGLNGGLVGPLYHVGSREKEVMTAIEQNRPELAGKFLPIMLNHEAAFPVIGYIGLVIGVPLALLCLFNISKAAWAMQHPESHRIFRRLAKFGDPKDIAAQVDREIAAGPVTRHGKSYLTSLWILRPTAFGLITVQLADIVWMYRLQQTESFAVLCLRTGKAMAVPLRGEQVQRLLDEIAERVPWVLYGYDLNRLKIWRKRPADVIAIADAQRKEYIRR